MTKQRIAIVGGGMAALATAFELTQRGDLQERFDITIYQMGWRLGGKGATGRDSQGRVVEHGLHIWFGCYENAFRMLRTAYEDWKPFKEQAIKSCEGALKAQQDSSIGVGDGSEITCLNWPPARGKPGIGVPDLAPFSAFSQMLHVVQCFYDQLVKESIVDSPRDLPIDLGTIELLELAGIDINKYTEPDTARAGSQIVIVRHNRCLKLGSDWSRILASSDAINNETQIRGFATFIQQFAKHVLHDEKFGRSAAGRFLAQLIDVGTATIKGVAVDMILRGATVGDLDLMDFREWLAICGAERASFYGSPIIQALYDSMLQYCEGDQRRPSYGAGTAAQAVVRLYGTYRHAFAFEMQSGMGEVVVVPLYGVLKQRGVKFEFFMKLKRVGLNANRDSVAQLAFDRQVCLRDGKYCPTIAPSSDNGYLECWPDAPLWGQIVCGEQLAAKNIDLESYWCSHRVDEVTLQQGHEFDAVVLAIPLGAFKKLNAAPGPCDELIEANSRFRAMTEMASLVPSISVQLWCNTDVAELGFPPKQAAPPGAAVKTVISTGPDPLDIWADMSQVLKYERADSRYPPPKSLHYLCGVFETDLFRALPDQHHVPAMANEQARRYAIDWLNNKSKYIWPKLNSGGRFDWSILFDPKNAKGAHRIDAQVCRANIDPSSCCVASSAGSTQWRLATDASGFNNLYLAGAWIDTGFNTECIEAAVISGMQAARAVSEASFAIIGEDFLRFGQGLPSLIALAAEGATLLLEVVTGAVRTGSGTETDRRSSATRFTSSESRP
jgi:uncharacterized protein with NAD-binding domain and iron-sulfur cluster